MDRIFDLNDRQKCVTAVLKISDKEFRISRVVTGVRVIYSNMLTDIYSNVVSFLSNGQIPLQSQPLQSASVPRPNPKLKEGREELSTSSNAPQQREVTQPIKVEKKIGRNDPCPCGSGKKYKNCHGRVS